MEKSCLALDRNCVAEKSSKFCGGGFIVDGSFCFRYSKSLQFTGFSRVLDQTITSFIALVVTVDFS